MADQSPRGKSPVRPSLGGRQGSGSSIGRRGKGNPMSMGDPMSTGFVRPLTLSSPVTLDGSLGSTMASGFDPLILGEDGKPASVIQPQTGRLRSGGNIFTTSPTTADEPSAPSSSGSTDAVADPTEDEPEQHPGAQVKLVTGDPTKHTQYKGEPCHCNKLLTNIEKILKELEAVKAALNRIEARYAAVPAAPPQVMAQRQAGPTGGFRQFDFNV